MDEIWQYIQVADKTFWGADVYHVWFYVAIVLIIIFAKSSIIKRVIGLYPVFFILALYSPIAYWLIQRYTSGHWAYFARLYSMIPLPVTIGFGTILLIDFLCTRGKLDPKMGEELQPRIHNGCAAFKLILTSGCCALMVFGGTNVYEQDWMKPAQNTNKVPDEARAICQVLHDDEGVTIAVPDSLSSYIRQIDASFFMPYGRNLNALGVSLSQEHPDPFAVMKEAGRVGCDYIVINANDTNRDAFRESGWEPYTESETYMIYKVEKVPRLVQGHDKQHRVSSSKNLTALGETICFGGRYITHYQHDKRGRVIKELYCDANDKPMIRTDLGFASKDVSYNKAGNIVKEEYYDLLGNKTMTDLGYASYIATYDANSVKTWEQYFDEDGLLICEVGNDGSSKKDNIFHFFHCSENVIIQKNQFTLTTPIEDNYFHAVRFQIYDSNCNRYFGFFGETINTGTVSGQYKNEFPGGLYTIVIKGNSNLRDESVGCLAYLKEGDILTYQFEVEELTGKWIKLKNVSIQIEN